MILRLSLSFVIMAAAIVAAIFTNGSNVSALQIIMALLPMLITPLGVLVAGPGPAAIRDIFRLARKGGSEPERQAAAATLKTFDRALVLSAILGVILRLAYIMKSLADPTAVWRNIAWSLTPVLVGFFLHAALRLPLGYAAENSGAPSASGPSAARPWSPLQGFAGAVITLAGIVCFEPGAFFIWLLADTPSFLIAVFVPISMILAGSRYLSLKKSWNSLKKADANPEELSKAHRAFRFLGTAFRSAAVIGSSLGLILLLRDFMEKRRAGPSLALLLLSAFWSIILYLAIALPLEAAAERRLLATNRL